MSLNWWSQQEDRHYVVKGEKNLQQGYRIINPNFPQSFKIRMIHQAQGRRPEGVINILFRVVNKYHEKKVRLILMSESIWALKIYGYSVVMSFSWHCTRA